jgi:hypothetical protein
LVTSASGNRHAKRVGFEAFIGLRASLSKAGSPILRLQKLNDGQLMPWVHESKPETNQAQERQERRHGTHSASLRELHGRLNNRDDGAANEALTVPSLQASAESEV